MDDVLIISTIVILLIISIWLYLSLEKVKTNLDIDTSLSPQTSIESFLIPPITKRQILAARIQKMLSWFSMLADYQHSRESPLPMYSPPSMSIEPHVSGCDADGGFGFEAPPRIVKYHGLAQIPLKVYQGDSYNITLTLRPSIRNPVRNETPIKIYRQNDKVNITLTVSSKEKEYLEIEMMAAGFSVDGEKKQRQLLAINTLRYQWNCFFEKSGLHSFAFIFRVVASSGDTLQIGRVEQTIKVAQIDHLTQRQVWILASSAGVLSGVLTLAEILRNLGIW